MREVKATTNTPAISGVDSAINTGAAAAQAQGSGSPAISVAAPLDRFFEDLTTTITIKGVEHTIVYNMGNLSPALKDRLATMGSATDESAAEGAMVSLVGTVVESWTLTDEDSEPLPVSKAGARQLGYRTLAALTTSLMSGDGGDSSENATASTKAE